MTQQSRAHSRLLSLYSKVLAPAVVLAALLVLTGIHAGLGLIGVSLLLLGVGVVPGIIHKVAKPAFRRRGLADYRRTDLVAALMFLGSVVCFLIPAPAPVPGTVAALFIGNAGLTLFRRWSNVSAHVSVLTFGVLWVVAVHGTPWLPLLLLLPVMIISRLNLREHTLLESLSGSAWGFCTFGLWLAQYWWRIPAAAF